MARIIDYALLAKCRADGLNILHTTRRLGISNATFYYRIKSDPQFQEAWGPTDALAPVEAADADVDAPIVVDPIAQPVTPAPDSEDLEECIVYLALCQGSDRHWQIRDATGLEFEDISLRLERLIEAGLIARVKDAGGAATYRPLGVSIDPNPRPFPSAVEVEPDLPVRFVRDEVLEEVETDDPDLDPDENEEAIVSDSSIPSVAADPDPEPRLVLTDEVAETRLRNERDWATANLILLYEQVQTGANGLGIKKRELLDGIESVLDGRSLNPLRDDDEANVLAFFERVDEYAPPPHHVRNWLNTGSLALCPN
jgi:hypothetical protein